METIIATLSDTLTKLQDALNLTAGCLIGEGYVIRMPGGFVRYSGGVLTLTHAYSANCYSFESASKIAATITDGNGTHGEAVHLRDALRAEIDKVSGMIAMLQAA